LPHTAPDGLQLRSCCRLLSANHRPVLILHSLRYPELVGRLRLQDRSHRCLLSHQLAEILLSGADLRAGTDHTGDAALERVCSVCREPRQSVESLLLLGLPLGLSLASEALPELGSTSDSVSTVLGPFVLKVRPARDSPGADSPGADDCR
jgi:hypothetical protein